jgi:replicative DNA helicase
MNEEIYLNDSYHEEYVLSVILNEIRQNPKCGFNTVKALNVVSPEYLGREADKFLLSTLKTALDEDSSVNGAILKHKGLQMYGFEWWEETQEYFSRLATQKDTSTFDESLKEVGKIHAKKRFLKELGVINSNASNKSLEESKDVIRDLVDGITESDVKEANLAEVGEDLLNGVTTFVSSGSQKLNNSLGGGFEPGQMIVLAGRPGAGKSSYCMQLANNRQVEGEKTLFFTMEMKSKKVLTRVIAQRKQKSLHSLKHIRTASVDEKVQIQNAIDEINNGLFSIYDDASQTMNDISSEVKSKIRQSEVENTARPSLIIIDYLGLITTKETVEYVALSYLSREIKKLAMECSVPILVLAQLNRKLEERTVGNQKPKLSDLRGSGAIEQDADSILFVHREAMYDQELDRNQPHEALIVIAKNREGEVIDVPYMFQPGYGRWL